MKNLKNITIVIFTSFFSIISCNDDFVYVESNDVNSEAYFNSEEEYFNALVGAYDLLGMTYQSSILGEIASDNTLCGGESATDVPGYQQIDDMIHTANNIQLRDIFKWMYAGLNRANFILEFQDRTDFEGREIMIAEAHFLRAYYYFELVKWFGPVPLVVDKRIQYGDQFSLPRTPVSEIYTQLEKDLIYAAGILPEVQTLVGRATKGAALALLGKIYLYQNKYNEAAEALDDVIMSNNYSLVENFADLFENDTTFEFENPSHVDFDTDTIEIEDHILLNGKPVLYESVVDYNHIKLAATKQDVIDNRPIDLTSGVASVHTLFAQYENSQESVFEVQYSDMEGGGFGCFACVEGNIAVGFSGIRKYVGSPFGPRFESGYSFNVPTQESYDSYNDLDTRRDASILDIEKWVADWGTLGITISYGQGYEHTGFFNRKYLPRKRDANIPDPNLTNPNNYRSIRYADVLLMAAEAHNKKSSPNPALARDYLNQVRERAFGNSDFNITSLSGDALNQTIFNERRLELMGEGHRFFDLVRTGQAKNFIAGFQEGKHELFPIPVVEIELTGNNWEQNPGY
jgi:hypothetical protein